MTICCLFFLEPLTHTHTHTIASNSICWPIITFLLSFFFLWFNDCHCGIHSHCFLLMMMMMISFKSFFFVHCSSFIHPPNFFFICHFFWFTYFILPCIHILCHRFNYHHHHQWLLLLFYIGLVFFSWFSVPLDYTKKIGCKINHKFVYFIFTFVSWTMVKFNVVFVFIVVVDSSRRVVVAHIHSIQREEKSAVWKFV